MSKGKKKESVSKFMWEDLTWLADHRLLKLNKEFYPDPVKQIKSSEEEPVVEISHQL